MKAKNLFSISGKTHNLFAIVGLNDNSNNAITWNAFVLIRGGKRLDRMRCRVRTLLCTFYLVSEKYNLLHDNAVGGSILNGIGNVKENAKFKTKMYSLQ